MIKTGLAQHIKKVLVTDALTTPEARAERLRRVRNMANLSRQEMCDTGLNINTYKGWEIARYGGLPIDGADKVVKRVLQEGVICSSDWLLYGKDQEPYVLPKESINIGQDGIINDAQPKERLIKEVMVFQSFYPNAFFVELEDDGMAPQYEQGDFVAGIRKYGNDIDSILNRNCIVQTKDGKILVRYLRAIAEKNQYMLICTNPNTSAKVPIIIDAEVEFACEITRHYKVINK